MQLKTVYETAIRNISTAAFLPDIFYLTPNE